MAIGKLLNMTTSLPAPIKGDGFSSINVGKSEVSGKTAFSDMVKNGIKSVNESMQEFDAKAKGFANGEQVSLHEMMISSEKAEIKMRMLVTMRNKVVEAYQEIMRLQV